jgi:hypothetical protein
LIAELEDLKEKRETLVNARLEDIEAFKRR